MSGDSESGNNSESDSLLTIRLAPINPYEFFAPLEQKDENIRRGGLETILNKLREYEISRELLECLLPTALRLSDQW